MQENNKNKILINKTQEHPSIHKLKDLLYKAIETGDEKEILIRSKSLDTEILKKYYNKYKKI